MTVYLDASALVALHVETPARATVASALARDQQWATSGLTLTESLALVDRITDPGPLRDDLEDAVRLTWDRVAIVPVDQRCLDAAAMLMRTQPIRLSDSIHLSAALRLPTPLRFVTLDPAQIPVALSLGFEVIST
jgi:uncharacterized protein